MSILNQIGLAYKQYEEDYGEVEPCGGASDGSGIGWAGEIYPSVKSVQVFVCPDDTGAGDNNSPDMISYAVNFNLVGYLASPNTPIPVSISMMAAPSTTRNLFEVIDCSNIVYHQSGEPRWAIFGASGSKEADIIWSPAGNGLDAGTDYTLSGANSGEFARCVALEIGHQ